MIFFVSAPFQERNARLTKLVSKSTSFDANGEEEEGCEVELPPPMQIQERTFPPVQCQDKLQYERVRFKNIF